MWYGSDLAIRFYLFISNPFYAFHATLSFMDYFAIVLQQCGATLGLLVRSAECFLLEAIVVKSGSIGGVKNPSLSLNDGCSSKFLGIVS